MLRTEGKRPRVCVFRRFVFRRSRSLLFPPFSTFERNADALDRRAPSSFPIPPPPPLHPPTPALVHSTKTHRPKPRTAPPIDVRTARISSPMAHVDDVFAPAIRRRTRASAADVSRAFPLPIRAWPHTRRLVAPRVPAPAPAPTASSPPPLTAAPPVPSTTAPAAAPDRVSSPATLSRCRRWDPASAQDGRRRC